MSVHDVSVETVTEEFERNRQLVVGGAAAAVVAVFLPWITIDLGIASASGNGIDLFGDASLLFNGVVTAILGIAAAALLFRREWTEQTQKYVMGLGAGIALIGLVLAVSPESAFSSTGGSGQWLSDAVSPGLGVYLTAIAGAAIAAGGYLAYSEDDGGLGDAVSK